MVTKTTIRMVSVLIVEKKYDFIKLNNVSGYTLILNYSSTISFLNHISKGLL